MSGSENRQKVLIVDDSEMNRDILSAILGEDYDIIEAENGAEGVAILEKDSVNISVVLLDINMPVMDGYSVLEVMNKKNWIDDVPVVMISADGSIPSMRRAFELGVKEFISRPFDAVLVRHRVVNTIMLSAKQKRLVEMVSDQIYDKEKDSRLMINILSHIVEFRNGESGTHVLHVQTYTEIFLRQLVQITDKYPIDESDISFIVKASALHDIGKISIPDEILNKPGRFTKEEFEIMKTHSLAGATMLKELHHYQNEPLVKIAYEICRWHHERFDGRGYPDGLTGDEIPISAQIVALADVYDALTSKRVYKDAFSHEEAMNMILNGECGCFNPLLLECLKQASEPISHVKENETDPAGLSSTQAENKSENYVHEFGQYKELSASEEVLRLLEYERMKNDFYASISNELHFEYTVSPPMLRLSPNGSHIFDLTVPTVWPIDDERLTTMIDMDELKKIGKMLRETTPQSPVIQYNCKVRFKDEIHNISIICRSVWKNKSEFYGAVGKIADIGIC